MKLVVLVVMFRCPKCGFVAVKTPSVCFRASKKFDQHTTRNIPSARWKGSGNFKYTRYAGRMYYCNKFLPEITKLSRDLSLPARPSGKAQLNWIIRSFPLGTHNTSLPPSLTIPRLDPLTSSGRPPLHDISTMLVLFHISFVFMHVNGVWLLGSWNDNLSGISENGRWCWKLFMLV